MATQVHLSRGANFFDSMALGIPSWIAEQVSDIEVVATTDAEKNARLAGSIVGLAIPGLGWMKLGQVGYKGARIAYGLADAGKIYYDHSDTVDGLLLASPASATRTATAALALPVSAAGAAPVNPHNSTQGKWWVDGGATFVKDASFGGLNSSAIYKLTGSTWEVSTDRGSTYAPVPAGTPVATTLQGYTNHFSSLATARAAAVSVPGAGSAPLTPLNCDAAISMEDGVPVVKLGGFTALADGTVRDVFGTPVTNEALSRYAQWQLSDAGKAMTNALHGHPDDGHGDTVTPRGKPPATWTSHANGQYFKFSGLPGGAEVYANRDGTTLQRYTPGAAGTIGTWETLQGREAKDFTRRYLEPAKSKWDEQESGIKARAETAAIEGKLADKIEKLRDAYEDGGHTPDPLPKVNGDKGTLDTIVPADSKVKPFDIYKVTDSAGFDLTPGGTLTPNHYPQGTEFTNFEGKLLAKQPGDDWKGVPEEDHKSVQALLTNGHNEVASDRKKDEIRAAIAAGKTDGSTIQTDTLQGTLLEQKFKDGLPSYHEYIPGAGITIPGATAGDHFFRIGDGLGGGLWRSGPNLEDFKFINNPDTLAALNGNFDKAVLQKTQLNAAQKIFAARSYTPTSTLTHPDIGSLRTYAPKTGSGPESYSFLPRNPSPPMQRDGVYRILGDTVTFSANGAVNSNTDVGALVEKDSAEYKAVMAGVDGIKNSNALKKELEAATRSGSKVDLHDMAQDISGTFISDGHTEAIDITDGGTSSLGRGMHVLKGDDVYYRRPGESEFFKLDPTIPRERAAINDFKSAVTEAKGRMELARSPMVDIKLNEDTSFTYQGTKDGTFAKIALRGPYEGLGDGEYYKKENGWYNAAGDKLEPSEAESIGRLAELGATQAKAPDAMGRPLAGGLRGYYQAPKSPTDLPSITVDKQQFVKMDNGYTYPIGEGGNHVRYSRAANGDILKSVNGGPTENISDEKYRRNMDPVRAYNAEFEAKAATQLFEREGKKEAEAKFGGTAIAAGEFIHGKINHNDKGHGENHDGWILVPDKASGPNRYKLRVGASEDAGKHAGAKAGVYEVDVVYDGTKLALASKPNAHYIGTDGTGAPEDVKSGSREEWLVQREVGEAFAMLGANKFSRNYKTMDFVSNHGGVNGDTSAKNKNSWGTVSGAGVKVALTPVPGT